MWGSPVAAKNWWDCHFIFTPDFNYDVFHNAFDLLPHLQLKLDLTWYFGKNARRMAQASLDRREDVTHDGRPAVFQGPLGIPMVEIPEEYAWFNSQVLLTVKSNLAADLQDILKAHDWKLHNPGDAVIILPEVL